MSKQNEEKPILKISTRGLGIKTPDEFLPESEMQMRFLYDDISKTQTHKLEIRIEIDGEKYQSIIPKPNSKIAIKIKNASSIPNDSCPHLSDHLINLNKIHGADLPDLDPMPLKLIDVNIKAPNKIKPYSAELNNIECYTEMISGTELPINSFTKKFTRFIGADFLLDNNAEISINIDSPKEEISIKPKGRDISLILDNDCLSEKEDGFGDFKLYYEVLNGGDTRVKLKPASKVQSSDLMVACNAIEGGRGG